VNDEPFARCDASVAFLRNLNDDWADLVACLHGPKAAREPHEALVRAIGYQQLTAKADDAIIARLKALYPIPPSRRLRTSWSPSRRRARMQFLGDQDRHDQAIAEGTLSGPVPPRNVAGTICDELIARVVTNQRHRPLDRRDATYVFAGAHGHPAGRRFRGARRVSVARILTGTAQAERIARDRESLGAASHLCRWYLWRMPRERGNLLK